MKEWSFVRCMQEVWMMYRLSLEHRTCWTGDGACFCADLSEEFSQMQEMGLPTMFINRHDDVVSMIMARASKVCWANHMTVPDCFICLSVCPVCLSTSDCVYI